MKCDPWWPTLSRSTGASPPRDDEFRFDGRLGVAGEDCAESAVADEEHDEPF